MSSQRFLRCFEHVELRHAGLTVSRSQRCSSIGSARRLTSLAQLQTAHNKFQCLLQSRVMQSDTVRHGKLLYTACCNLGLKGGNAHGRQRQTAERTVYHDSRPLNSNILMFGMSLCPLQAKTTIACVCPQSSNEDAKTHFGQQCPTPAEQLHDTRRFLHRSAALWDMRAFVLNI